MLCIPRVQVTVAGSKDGVAAAKLAIKDITTKYYSTLTHPGITHAEFKVCAFEKGFEIAPRRLLSVEHVIVLVMRAPLAFVLNDIKRHVVLAACRV